MNNCFRFVSIGDTAYVVRFKQDNLKEIEVAFGPIRIANVALLKFVVEKLPSWIARKVPVHWLFVIEEFDDKADWLSTQSY